MTKQSRILLIPKHLIETTDTKHDVSLNVQRSPYSLLKRFLKQRGHIQIHLSLLSSFFSFY